MNKDVQRRIASKGGTAAHQQGTAHEWTSDEAREAGRKGGLALRGQRAAATEETAQRRAETTEAVLPHADHEHARFADEGNPHVD